MNRRTTGARALLALVILSVVLPLAAAPGGAVAGDGSTSTSLALANNSTSPEVTLSDLREGGERPAKAPPSVRASGTYSEYALKYLPTGIWVDDSRDSPSWRYLRPGTVVNRDELQLWSKRGYGLEGKDVTVRVAHYNVRRVQEGNKTVAKATNVTTYTIDATVGGGYDVISVDLRSHYQSAARTVICVQEPGEPNCLTEPNGLRWRFNHRTSRAMQSISLDSEGDKLAWGVGYMLLPFFASSLSFMFGARKAIKKAKSQPRIPWWIWPVLFVATLVSLFMFWDQIVATSVRAPWAMSLIGGAAIGLIAAVWFGDDRKLSLFLRLRPDEWVDTPPDEAGERAEAAPDGGESPLESDGPAQPGRASSTLVADAFPVPLVHGRNGERHHVADGFWNWIARARGAVAQLETMGDSSLKTRIEVEEGPYEELYVLDPEEQTEEVIEHEPEGHEWNIPRVLYKDENGWHFEGRAFIGAGIGVALSSLLGKVLLASAELGILIGLIIAVVWKFAQPSEGSLRVALANVHYQRALPTVLAHASEIADAATRDELFDQWQEAEMDKKISRQELEDRRDRTQMDRLADRYLGADAKAEDTNGSQQEVESDD